MTEPYRGLSTWLGAAAMSCSAHGQPQCWARGVLVGSIHVRVSSRTKSSRTLSCECVGFLIPQWWFLFFNFKAALWLLQFCYRIDPELYSVFDSVLWQYSPVTCNRQGRCSLPVSVAVCTGHFLLFQCVDVSFTTSACLLPLLFFSTDYKGSFTHVTF